MSSFSSVWRIFPIYLMIYDLLLSLCEMKDEGNDSISIDGGER